MPAVQTGHAPPATRRFDGAFACASLTALVTLIVGAVAYVNHALQAPLLGVIVSCVILGCLFPRRALLMGVIVGSAVPAAHFIHTLRSSGADLATIPGTQFIAIIVAIGGTYAGRFLRTLLRR
ncbi:MAG: hypothetical protein SGJ11_13065 [Phycisphaerae bacterium]|nr:hypothetical protein [Phycisphaerae bacterium]